MVIMAMPIHIHPTKNARRINRSSAAGRKSWTSPMSFMARVTHNSPPVPATMIIRNKRASRTSDFDRCGARMRLADDEDAKTDDDHAEPTQWRDDFAEEQVAEQRHHRVGKRGSWLHIAVVGPGEHQHVGHKKSEQRRHAEPDIAG